MFIALATEDAKKNKIKEKFYFTPKNLLYLFYKLPYIPVFIFRYNLLK